MHNSCVQGAKLVGVAIAWVLAIVGTVAILKLVDVTSVCEFQQRKKFRAWISPNTAKRDIIGRRQHRVAGKFVRTVWHDEGAENAEQDSRTS